MILFVSWMLISKECQLFTWIAPIEKSLKSQKFDFPSLKQDSLSVVSLFDRTSQKLKVSYFNETFFFLKPYQNQCQAQWNNKDFMQIRQWQQLLISIHLAPKVTYSVLTGMTQYAVHFFFWKKTMLFFSRVFTLLNLFKVWAS